MYTFIQNLIVLLAGHLNSTVLQLSYPFEQFRVCGAYCGPGWCNNKWLSESICDTSVKPEHHILTGDSCADSCCRSHDRCCGQEKGLQQACNNKIVDCLSKCNPFSLTCTYDDISIPAGTIEVAMDIIDEWCCGSECPAQRTSTPS